MIALFQKMVSVLQEGTLPVMLPLVLVCLGIGVMALERCLYLYDPRMLASWWCPPIRKRLKRIRMRINRAFEAFVNQPSPDTQQELRRACTRFHNPYTRFLARAAGEKLLDSRPGTVALRIERALHAEELGIERGFGLLSSFAKVAPLLGLLGTVTGMIQTFSAMMVASTSDPKALSSGISIALIATLVGLVVGMPGVICMGLLSRRGKTLQEEIRLASMQLRGLDGDRQVSDLAT